MDWKSSRPAALAGANRAENSKGLGGTFDPQFSSETNGPQDSDVPIALARIVIGRRYSFLYIRNCPLCGMEHMHGQFPVRGEGSDPLDALAACQGHRASHCHCHGPHRVARCTRGEWHTVIVYPPEWHEPEGYDYRLVLGPEPACFTPRGIKSKAARLAMLALTRRGVATSLEILRPRRRSVFWRGD
jgi:hypothetical protein